MAKSKKQKNETEATAAAPAEGAAAAQVDRGPRADRFSADVALKARKFGGVEGLIAQYPHPPSRRVCQLVLAALKEGESPYAAELEAYITKTFPPADPSTRSNLLVGRGSPQIGETRTFRVQQVIEKGEDKNPLLGPDGLPIAGAAFVRLNVEPNKIGKGGSVSAHYADADTIVVKIVRAAPAAAA